MKSCPVPFDQTSIYVLLAQQKTRWMHPRGGLTFAPIAAAGCDWSFCVFTAAHRLVMSRYSGVFCDKQTAEKKWNQLVTEKGEP